MIAGRTRMWVDRLLLGRTGRWPERLDPSAGLRRACPARRAARVASALNLSVPSTNTAATKATRDSSPRGIAHVRDDAPSETATAIRCGAALRRADPALSITAMSCSSLSDDRRMFLSGPAQHTRRRRRAHLLVAHLDECSYASRRNRHLHLNDPLIQWSLVRKSASFPGLVMVGNDEEHTAHHSSYRAWRSTR